MKYTKVNKMERIGLLVETFTINGICSFRNRFLQEYNSYCPSSLIQMILPSNPLLHTDSHDHELCFCGLPLISDL